MALCLPEFVSNPENRCPVVLVLDTSKSMEGEALDELNAALAAFKYDMERDSVASLRVEVALITFGGEAELIQDFTTCDDFTAPRLKAKGKTSMGGGLNMALDLLEARKNAYKANGIPYYRPWLMLITDGDPTDYGVWQEAAQRLECAYQNNKLTFFAVGVGEADMNTLAEVAPKARPPFKMQGLDFRSLFLWLSASVRRVSTSRVGDENLVELKLSA